MALLCWSCSCTACIQAYDKGAAQDAFLRRLRVVVPCSHEYHGRTSTPSLACWDSRVDWDSAGVPYSNSLHWRDVRPLLHCDLRRSYQAECGGRLFWSTSASTLCIWAAMNHHDPWIISRESAGSFMGRVAARGVGPLWIPMISSLGCIFC